MQIKLGLKRAPDVKTFEIWRKTVKITKSLLSRGENGEIKKVLSNAE